MATWVRVEDTLPDHPKTFRVADDLEIDPDIVIAKCVRLWLWCARIAPDGDLTSFRGPEIERAVGWSGGRGVLVRAWVNAGFLDETEEGYTIHDWWERAERMKAAQRKRKSRAKQKESLKISKSTRTVTPETRVSHGGRTDVRDETDVRDGQVELRALELTAPDSEPEPFLIFPCVGTPETWACTTVKALQWQQTFPDVPVHAELRKAWQWLHDNPKKQKTAGGMARYLGAWFGRANDKRDSTPGGGRAQSQADRIALHAMELRRQGK